MKMHERIAKAVAASGKKKVQIAKDCGVSASAVTQWLTGESKSLKPESIYALAAATGFRAEWLAMGKGPEREEPPKQVKSNAEYLGPIDAWDDDTPLDDDEVYVPFLKEVELSAGSGRVSVQESSGRKLRFGKMTLRRQGVQPSEAVCVSVSGNSMEPVLPDGSTVGVNRGATAIVDGKMYALDHSGQLRVKTLYRLPGGGIRMRSFNREEHSDEEYTADEMTENEISVIGKVFWSSALW